jgi:hypothetical protein
VRVDLHVHLQPYSRSSDFTLEAYAEAVRRHDLKVVTVTDYGTSEAAPELEKKLGGVMVVYGAELATHEGQFLVYGADRKFMKTLPARLRTLDELPRRDDLAVIWAHPRMPWRSGWRAPFPRQPLTKFIFQRVDGVEYFNGAMLSMAARGAVEPSYHEELREQIEKWNVAAVGGSACQTAEGFLTAWTTFPRLRIPQDFVTAIKDRAVKPGAILGKPKLQLVSA